MKATTKKKSRFFSDFISDPAGTRTQGPNIKSVVLYQLSYEINLFPLPVLDLGVQKYRNESCSPKKSELVFRDAFLDKLMTSTYFRIIHFFQVVFF